MKRVVDRWWPVAVLGLGAAVMLTTSDSIALRVLAVLLLVYAWMISPAFFPRSVDLQVALERADAGRSPVVFWKPGCLYCIRLRVGLGPSGRRVSWVDSSLDADARAVVRSKNAGDHTTPTVMFGELTRTNPDVGWVRELLR